MVEFVRLLDLPAPPAPPEAGSVSRGRGGAQDVEPNSEAWNPGLATRSEHPFVGLLQNVAPTLTSKAGLTQLVT